MMKRVAPWQAFLVVCFCLFASCSSDSDTASSLSSLTVTIENEIESVTLYDGELEAGKIISKILSGNVAVSRTIPIPTGNVCTVLTSKAPTGTLYASSAAITNSMSVLVKNDYSIRWADQTH